MKQCTNKEDNFQPTQQCSRSSVTIFHFENFYLILFFLNLLVSPPFPLKYQWQLSVIFLNILSSISTSPRPLRNEVPGTQLAPYLAPHSGCESELYPLRGTSLALASHWCLSFLWQLQRQASLLLLLATSGVLLACFHGWNLHKPWLPWELSPSPPQTLPAEGTHPLPPLLLPTDILTTLYSIWTLVTHIAYPEFPSFYLIPAFSIS